MNFNLLDAWSGTKPEKAFRASLHASTHPQPPSVTGGHTSGQSASSGFKR
jgi:hypothetical protein